MSKAPSPREQMAEAFAAWVSNQRGEDGRTYFTAPYGVIQGLAKNGKCRAVTFGVARISDICLLIFSPTYLVLQDSRFGSRRCNNLDEVKQTLRTNYRFDPLKA